MYKSAKLSNCTPRDYRPRKSLIVLTAPTILFCGICIASALLYASPDGLDDPNRN